MRSFNPVTLFWGHFDVRRTKEEGGDIEPLLENVNISLPAGSTHRDALEQIAGVADERIDIKSIPELLSERKCIRGMVFFGNAGRQIDQIVENYGDRNMHWWMAKDGLVVAVVSPKQSQLSEFDRFAGRLVVMNWVSGRLSKSALQEIAAELDSTGFPVLNQLQPAQRAEIAKLP
jgi:hypothetical protein